MTTFPLSFVTILSKAPLSINADVFGSSQNCSYVVLALSFRSALGMLRIESSSAMSQGYLDFHCRSSAISLIGLGLGPQCKMGQSHKSSHPTVSIARFHPRISKRSTKQILTQYKSYNTTKEISQIMQQLTNIKESNRNPSLILLTAAPRERAFFTN